MIREGDFRDECPLSAESERLFDNEVELRRNHIKQPSLSFKRRFQVEKA
jgi:hypothetical protein